MSTLSQRRAAAACAALPSAARSGVLRQLIAAREQQIKRRVISDLAQQSDDRLPHVGFTAEHIRALPAGGLRLERRQLR